ncbi:NADPH-dependent FMN reductase [Armatimonas sp.]|uniref:NADPH-dependent FMN reductase n=1 Tax=Armatimonas sp. TaxID=1872638 RepID=UPI0034D959CD
MHLLAISGSLRAVSSNTALLQVAALLAPEGVTVTLYDGLVRLPHFNPDDDDSSNAEVVALRQAVRESAGLLVSVPEYAHGLPGSFKNALDWLVSEVDFSGKPVAILHASPSSVHALASLREVLKTMDARIIEDACLTLPLRGKHLDAATLAVDPAFAEPLQAALQALTGFIETSA